MAMQAWKLTTEEEYTVGTEDRVFLSAGAWYYQIRGCAEAHGPFQSRREAEAAYLALAEESAG